MLDSIAIVGMACTFPQARNLHQFWSNIIHKRSAITTVPAHRWSPIYYDADSTRVDRFYANQGGFIDEYAYFNPLRFGIMPIAAQGAEPDQLLALQTAADALLDAGYGTHKSPHHNAQVILGRGAYIGAGMTQLNLHVRTAQQLIHTIKQLMPVSETQAQDIYQAFTQQLGHYAADSAIGLVPNLCASRIANRFNFTGAAYTVDAACASALVAVDHGIQALQQGKTDLVLAGGVHVVQDVTFWSVFSQLGALSRQQKIMPFSRHADGLLIGEGVGVVVLKRYADALRDGDRIYAQLVGSGISSDGQAASLMSPDQNGQVHALRQAWKDLDIADLGLLEAHGTATVVGDQTELQTLNEVFGQHPQAQERDHHTQADVWEAGKIGLGSVKSMIGHCMPAAGIAGLIKATLALYHGVLPATLHAEEPHELLTHSRFQLIKDTCVWPSTLPRVAAVNAFGFGGINAHVVLRAPHHLQSVTRPLLSHQATRDTLLTLAADTLTALVWALDQALQSDFSSSITQQWIQTQEDGRFELHNQVPATSHNKKSLNFPYRVAILAPTKEKIQQAMTWVKKGKTRKGRSGVWITLDTALLYNDDQVELGKVAFMYPGIEAVFQPHIDEACVRSAVAVPQLHLDQGLGAQGVSVIRLGLTLNEILASIGVRPDEIMGHSIGEWSGLISAGYLDKSAVEHFITQLKSDDLTVPDVLFLAVGAHQDKALQFLQDLEGLYCSHDNCPHQSIFCGPEAVILQAQDRLKEAKILAQVLPFTSGFHAPYFQPYAQAISAHLDRFDLNTPHTRLWSANTLQPYPHTTKALTTGALRDLSAKHLVEKVRFRELILAMYQAGVRVFVQVGLGSLSSFVDDTLRGRPYLALDAHSERKGAMEQLIHLSASLFTAGYPVDLSPWIQKQWNHDRSMRLHLGVPLVDLPAEMHNTLHADISAQPSNQSSTQPSAQSSTHPSAHSSAPTSYPLSNQVTLNSTKSPLIPTLVTQDIGASMGMISCPIADSIQLVGINKNLQDAIHHLDTHTSHASIATRLLMFLEDTQHTSMDLAIPADQAHYSSTPNSLSFTCERQSLTSLSHSISSWRTTWRIDLQQSPYLIDHCFFRQPDQWPHVIDRFPVVPLTLSLQWVMEQVQLLCHEQWRVIAVQNIRAVKWLEVEPAQSIAIQIDQIRLDCFKVSIKGHLSAEVLVSHNAPVAPHIAIQTLAHETIPHLQAQNIYHDRWMFHGPAYYGIKHLLAISPNGIRGVLYNQGTPGALLDNVGQLFGLWVMLQMPIDRVVMPISIRKVSFFAPPPPLHAELLCQVWIEHLDKREVRAHMCLWYHDRVWATFEAWKDWRFDTSEDLWNLMRYPEYSLYSRVLPIPSYHIAPSMHKQTSSNSSLSTSPYLITWAQGVSAVASSREFLVGRCLSTEERNHYRSLKQNRQQSWLAGRIAAKDAARAWVWQTQSHTQVQLEQSPIVSHLPHQSSTANQADSFNSPAIFPIEIQTTTDHPIISYQSGPHTQDLQVSVAHKEGCAVALCSAVFSQVGVDLEMIEERSMSWIQASFHDEEQDLLRESLGTNDLAYTVGWCVKEAYAKATKEGLGNPKKWKIQASDQEQQRVKVNQQWVYWQQVEDYIVAYVVYST